MSDPSIELRPALETWLRNDTEVKASFNGKTVKVYKTLPPVDARPPYIFIAGLFVLADIAECMDNAEVDLQLDVWSLMDPPGFSEAERIAQAVMDSVMRLDDDNSPAFTLTNYLVASVQPISTNYLTDPSDGKTVHAVINARLAVDEI